jgi:DNA-binding PadR family transcriptional regulator
MELLILSVLDGETRHGYAIGKELVRRSGGDLQFKVSTLYSALYRMEEKGLIKGRWVEKAGQRRRCYYKLTARGRTVLASQTKEWKAFAAMVDQVIGVSHA